MKIIVLLVVLPKKVCCHWSKESSGQQLFGVDAKVVCFASSYLFLLINYSSMYVSTIGCAQNFFKSFSCVKISPILEFKKDLPRFPCSAHMVLIIFNSYVFTYARTHVPKLEN